ncbi:MAG: PadR family transcriptional regulator [Ilumatobacteraceae bacterium]
MTDARPRLLGEWACLGLLAASPSHGFALAARLSPTGDVGRVWSMSRPLTYRALDQLVARGLVEQVGVEPGRAGGPRSVMAPTPPGRRLLDDWLSTPVEHLRDLRSELLVKLVLLESLGRSTRALLTSQRLVVATAATALEAGAAASDSIDAVAVWRAESAAAALRVLDRLLARLPS